ncbi:MAG: heavy-metal-associated domain-containing protein [Coriobacteriia bacterium]
MRTNTLNVNGMHCSSCSMLITMNLTDLEGVKSVSCDHATGQTDVTFDDSKVTTDRIISEIADAGYTAKLVG